MEILLGAFISLVVQGIKKWLGTSTWYTYLALLLVSVLVGFVWQQLIALSLWESVLQGLIYATAFYTLVIKRFEK